MNDFLVVFSLNISAKFLFILTNQTYDTWEGISDIMPFKFYYSNV